MASVTVRDVLAALQAITRGRMVASPEEAYRGGHPYAVWKSSGIPGKEVLEIPGLVFGEPEMAVEKLAVVMTLTETVVELAAACGVEALVVHHPVADAASCGGVSLKSYLAYYRLAIFELHEAFHGLHPGIALLHGHEPFHVETSFRGIPGNVVMVGRPLPGVNCLQDVLERLGKLMGRAADVQLLEAERSICRAGGLQEVSALEGGRILVGEPASPVGLVLHCFPHTGFSAVDLEAALEKYPGIKTVIASISRISGHHPLAGACRERGINLLAGNSHALEIWENGLPLAYALQALLPGVEVLVFRERVTAYPLEVAGAEALRQYAREMAYRFLLPTPNND